MRQGGRRPTQCALGVLRDARHRKLPNRLHPRPQRRGALILATLTRDWMHATERCLRTAPLQQTRLADSCFTLDQQQRAFAILSPRQRLTPKAPLGDAADNEASVVVLDRK